MSLGHFWTEKKNLLKTVENWGSDCALQATVGIGLDKEVLDVSAGFSIFSCCSVREDEFPRV